ncbi:2OG-Fe(II) oxygenase [Pelagibius sp. Alg239-R121]|uniref:2OG-Fe(II) oxygenase n=1 Tax=Pelagibius sp. Alg239-R121 TaxID=2993448 RepID=UPI0024A61F73|nr:2OG-Fe(II) oxygenase [Pelagibius sp. Alg239-R121]
MTAELVSRHLGVGDVFPHVQLKAADGRLRVPVQFAGQPLLVHLCASGLLSSHETAGDNRTLLPVIAGARQELTALGLKLLVIERAEEPTNPDAPGSACDVERLKDPADAIAKAFNFGRSGATLLLNENQRVLAIFDPRVVSCDRDGLLTAATTLLPRRPFMEAKIHAPVLRIPRVFDPECCKHLIGIFENSPHQPSGFNEQRKDGAPLVFDEKVKKRRDFVVGTGTPLAEQIRVLYMRRLIPEVAKAFHFEVKSHEAFKIARYDAEDKGFFRRHRDNTNAANAHRRFAVSINLNAEDHEGGHLVFPEYCESGYRPATGEALVFCCSLLHEARPVTRGSRYVQLAFLY